MPRFAVLSPTSAAVLHTAEAEGQDFTPVARDEAIVTLESCKLEIPVNAPMAGRAKFFVQPGEVVAEGQLLAEIIT